jgi:luciferase family oxidoreductase group 1
VAGDEKMASQDPTYVFCYRVPVVVCFECGDYLFHNTNDYEVVNMEKVKKSLRLSVLDMVPLLEGADVGRALHESVRLVQALEKLGYHRYWISEHHDMEALASTCPEVLLAHIGAHTKHIRIGSGAVLIPHYKPLKVAEAFHLLASLYPGRVDLGVGRAPGGSAHVTMALSGNFLEQIQQVPQSIQALTDLLAGKFQVDGESVYARPIPPVAPELWMLGTNRKSAQYAAQYGTRYVFGQFMSDQEAEEVLATYREEFQPSPLLKQSEASLAVGVVCAETEEEAQLLTDQALRKYGSEAGSIGMSEKVLTGTPEQVKDKLIQLQQKLKVNEFILTSFIQNYDQRMKSYTLLANAMHL